ncbi:MAG: hypothetical protein N2C14_10310, partial [Planctomycetales bacterium]
MSKQNFRTLVHLSFCAVAAAALPVVAQDDVLFPPVRDPAVEIILESNPQTPDRLVRAIRNLIDLDHAAEARPFVLRLNALKLDAEAQVKLANEFGIPVFLKILQTPELQADAKEFCEAVIAAAREDSKDNQRITGEIEALKSDSPFARDRAMRKLKSAGASAVPPLVAMLADPGQAGHHPAVRAALIQQGDAALHPLLAALESREPALQQQVLQVLAARGQQEAIPFVQYLAVSLNSAAAVRKAAQEALLRMTTGVPTKREALVAIYGEAIAYHNQLRKPPVGLDGQVELWTWDGQAKKLVGHSMNQEDAAIAIASRLAADAFEIAPQIKQVRRLYLETVLESGAYANGLDKSLKAEHPSYVAARKVGIAALLEYINTSLGSAHSPGLIGALKIVGDAADESILHRQGSLPSAVVKAAAHRDRRVRMAAIQAIFKVKPTRTFPGSSMVVHALKQFVSHSGLRRAVVAESRGDYSSQVAGLLSEMGYDVEQATDALSLQKHAARGDCEIVFVGMSLKLPGPDFAVEQLRRDFRTASLPIGIMAAPDAESRAKRLARRYPMTRSFIRPMHPDQMAFQVGLLVDKHPRQL